MNNFTKNSDPIYDKDIKIFIQNILSKKEILKFENCSNQQFVKQYKKWLKNSTFNSITGLDKFKYGNYSYGSTTAIAEFIKRNADKRLRVSKDDFLLSKILSKSYKTKFTPLEDEEIKKNDVLVISHPFSGNGDIYPSFKNVLDQCDKNDVPVLIDGAYFGISHDLHYPLDRKCIKEFTSSLSKNFGVQNLRIGIRLSKDFIDDALNAPIQMADCFNKLNALIGIKLMKKFSADYIIKKYTKVYDKICTKFNLIPTQTVTFGLGDKLSKKNKSKFQRGSYVRVCISKALVKNFK